MGATANDNTAGSAPRVVLMDVRLAVWLGCKFIKYIKPGVAEKTPNVPNLVVGGMNPKWIGPPEWMYWVVDPLSLSNDIPGDENDRIITRRRPH